MSDREKVQQVLNDGVREYLLEDGHKGALIDQFMEEGGISYPNVVYERIEAIKEALGKNWTAAIPIYKSYLPNKKRDLNTT